MKRREFIKNIILVKLGCISRKKDKPGTWRGVKYRTRLKGKNYKYWWDRALSQNEREKIHKTPFVIFNQLKPKPKINRSHPLVKGLVSYDILL